MRKRIIALLATAVMVVSSTIMAFADTETGLIGKYEFNGDLKNAAGDEEAKVTAEKVNIDVTNEKAAFGNGVDGKGLLMYSQMNATGKYGVEVIAPKSNSFTISYDIYYLAYSKHTATMFLGNSWDGTTDTWASFGNGWKDTLAFAAGIWVHDQAEKTPQEWVDVWSAEGNADALLNADGAWAKWTNITYSVSEGVPTVYINGEAIEVAGADLAPIDFINDTTRLFVGVNAWDMPLNAGVDNLYIYDRALSADDVKELIADRDYDAAVSPAEPPETTKNKPAVADKDKADYLVPDDTPAAPVEDGGNTGMIIGIAVAAVVVIVIVVVVAVVAGKKKTSAEDDDEE